MHAGSYGGVVLVDERWESNLRKLGEHVLTDRSSL